MLSGDDMREALTNRITSGGVHVVRLHYAADADKDPSTPQGAAWANQQLKGYPRGLQDKDWLKEMEIIYSAGGGQNVFERFSEWRTGSNIFIPPAPDLTGAKLYASYDHGWTNPAAYLVHAVYPGGLKRTIWEFYAPEVPVSMIAEVIQGNAVTTPDGRRFEGNPYAGRESFKISDPEIDRRTQSMYDGTNKSVARLFQDHGVHFTMGERGDDGMVINWLLGNLWADPEQPYYQICSNCRYLIWELSRLQYPKINYARNRKEDIVDKDNHAWDALKYFLKRFPTTGKPKPKPSDANTFAWWCKISEDYRKGKKLPAFRREMIK